jgi:hypothetical protein
LLRVFSALNSEVLFGILSPEVIPLRVRILRVGKSDEEDVLHDGAVIKGGATQLSPILSLAAIDYIVYRWQDISHPVLQMPVQHDSASSKYALYGLLRKTYHSWKVVLMIEIWFMIGVVQSPSP